MNQQKRQAQKAKRRRDQIRREQHATRLSQPSLIVVGSDDFEQQSETAAPPLPSRLLGERMMRKIHRLLEQEGFDNAEQAQGYLNALIGQSLDDEAEKSDDPIERAQELAYDAMDADTPQEGRELAEAALELDPDCVDALTVLALFAPSAAARAAQLGEAVKAGERRLGKEFFEENKGHFWGLLETRPYMRARQDLARALILRKRPHEAAQHYEALIELCPDDNLGVRYELLGLYLLSDQMESALGVIERYQEDSSAFFRWAAALVFFTLRRFEEAQRALKAARRANRHVERYFLDDEAVMPDLPAFYGIGDEEEAAYCAFHQMIAWRLRPLARFWLQSGGRPGDGKYLGCFRDFEPAW